MKMLIRKLLASKVLAGPFRGMRYPLEGDKVAYWAKVFGTYEKEIEHVLIPLIDAAESQIINVGTAEGYFAVGSLYRNPELRVTGYEMSESTRANCRRLAELNGVSERLQLKGLCDLDSLVEEFSGTLPDLLLMDVEGAEMDLLDPLAIPSLAQTNIVVELHEHLRAGVVEAIRQRFESSHEITQIESIEKGSDAVDPGWPRLLCRFMLKTRSNRLHEGRITQMSWFVMRPKG